MFKCPACKKPSVTFKQKFLTLNNKIIICSNCGAKLSIRKSYWKWYDLISFGIFIFIYNYITSFIQSKYKLIYDIIAIIPVLIIYFILGVFFKRLIISDDNKEGQ